jgi:hypothetical protein
MTEATAHARVAIEPIHTRRAFLRRTGGAALAVFGGAQFLLQACTSVPGATPGGAAAPTARPPAGPTPSGAVKLPTYVPVAAVKAEEHVQVGGGNARERR